MCAIECKKKTDVSRVLPLPQWKMSCLKATDISGYCKRALKTASTGSTFLSPRGRMSSVSAYTRGLRTKCCKNS